MWNETPDCVMYKLTAAFVKLPCSATAHTARRRASTRSRHHWLLGPGVARAGGSGGCGSAMAASRYRIGGHGHPRLGVRLSRVQLLVLGHRAEALAACAAEDVHVGWGAADLNAAAGRRLLGRRAPHRDRLTVHGEVDHPVRPDGRLDDRDDAGEPEPAGVPVGELEVLGTDTEHDPLAGRRCVP